MTRLGPFVLLLGLFAAGCRPSPAQVPPEPTLVGASAVHVHGRLRALTDSGFSGVVLVALGDSVVLHQAYGASDRTKRHPLTLQTQFNIASITKQFTGAAILRLEERGRLSTHDTLGRFFPWVSGTAARITLHQLLTHTSGITQHYAADGLSDLRVAVDAVLATPRDTTGAFSYSNDAYSLLAAVVSTVAVLSWEEFVRREFLAPNGMHMTAFWGDPPVRDARLVAQPQTPFTDAQLGRSWGFRGGAGMWSTAWDLYGWHRALIAGDVLHPANRARLRGGQAVVRPGIEYGYGWFTTKTGDETEIWTRGTEGFGHNAVIRWFPAEGLVVIVVSNAGSVLGRPANQSVSDAVLAVLRPDPSDGR